MPKLNEKLSKCLKEGEKEGRHKGLKKIEPDKGLALDHLEKARHNFKAITTFVQVGFSDWSASAAFYTLYHCLLGILAKNGFESRNQSCTFAVVEDLIKRGKVKEVTEEELKEIYDSDVIEDLENSPQILDIIEDMQYSTKTLMENDRLNKLKERTSILLEKLRREIER